MSHRLHTVHIHKQNTDYRAGQHISHKHFHAVGNHTFITDKEPDNRFPEDKIQNRRYDSRHKTAFFRIPLHALEPRHISGAVIISQKGLNPVCQSHLQESNKHICLKYDADSRYRIISIYDQKLIEHNRGHTHKRGKDSRRQPGRTGPFQNTFLYCKMLPVYGEHPALFQEIPQIIRTCQNIADSGRNGSACRSLIQHGNKNGIQHDIGDGSDHTSDHCFPAGAFCPDNKTCGSGPDNKGRAVGNMERISPCKFTGLFICAE